MSFLQETLGRRGRRWPAALTALVTGLLCASVLLAACSGTGTRASATGEDGGVRLCVTMRDYGTAQVFELASESHTDRLAYYSKVRNDASRKVQTDEVMELLVDQLDSDGYQRYAQPGRAPSAGGAALSRALEVEAGDVTSHWVIGGGSALEERKAFNTCLETFLGLYNVSASYQTVENPHGHEFFEHAPEAAAGQR